MDGFASTGVSMKANALERVTDAAIAAVLWAFRVAVVLIVVVGSYLTLTSGRYDPSYWVDAAATGLVQGSIYALMALGYTMVYGILRMINFAHGEIFMSGAFGGYFAATVLSGAGFLNQSLLTAVVSVLLMIAASILVAVPLALLVERIAYRPLRNAPRLVPLISAIGASFVLQYTFRGFLGAGIYAYPDVTVLNQELPLGAIRVKWVEILVVASAFLMMGVLYLFVMRTRIGTAIRAVSEDMDTAALMGIDVNRAIVTTFALGAAPRCCDGRRCWCSVRAPLPPGLLLLRVHPGPQGLHRGRPRRDRQHPRGDAGRALPRRGGIDRAHALPRRLQRPIAEPAQGRDRLHHARAGARVPPVRSAG
jgi:branched-subunit amino acid ABC-type transport system permease component